MNKIINILKNNPAVKTLSAGKGAIVTNNASDEAYLIAGAFSLHKKTMFIIKENQYQAMQLYHYLKDILDDVYYYPADESMRVESIAYSYELLGERINTMYALTSGKPIICIAHMHSLVHYISDPKIFASSILEIKVGDIIDPKELREKLIYMGYQITQRVDSPFYMAKRGGVMDVYSIQYDDPIRIEFFDDEIEEIAFFNKDTQRRAGKLDHAILLPATDMQYNDTHLDDVINKITSLKEDMECEMPEELDSTLVLDIESLKAHDYNPRIYQYMSLFGSYSILDYHPDALIVTGSYQGIVNRYRDFSIESYQYFTEIQKIGQMIKGLKLIQDPQILLKKRHVDMIPFKENDKQVAFNTRPIVMSMMSEKVFVDQLKDYLIFNKVLVCLGESRQIRQLSELLEVQNVSYTLVGADDRIYDGVNIYRGDLKQGIELIDEKIVILTEKELFKTTTTKKKYIRYKDAVTLSNYNELNVGDYVVHDVNGIGQYMGIKTLEVRGTHKDFLHIAYKGNDVLYVPVENFKLIRKYVSRDGKPPRVHALNSVKWQKEKARVRAKVDSIAEDLIALYAERMRQPGFAFPPDDEYQLEFETKFGYELTPDQERSVAEIKEDMEKPRPMDRLLCGDVGFGKTEVALRACFKAILADKQCAFLCPTTILSSQHYHTIIERFKDFPVTIALLNRFTSTAKRKQILADLKAGKIDFLVGTHRILSKDVEFKDLGLLCIDEEQRFGVRQKEKIKNLRKSIDVLTLTATPIPRTLQMSLMGIRGLSNIDTPPRNRLPVQTYVSERSLPLVKQVIERELARGGQVFYLYNRTDHIDEMAASIGAMIPDARIGVGHGRMDKNQLERVMEDFIDQKYDILVCTTIIETGIDIPNANTIVIEDADRFGLAQLYQIKGRVGRSERLAYAYLLYRKNKQLTDEAAKRLKAIKEFTQLGSGYKIAMRDLAIRGAGDILGGEQAGFIDSVGFDMYMKILQDAINEKQGKKVEEEEIPSSNVQVDGYIPSDYVDSDIEKLELYQRICRAQKRSQLDQVEKELVDLYGSLPRQIKNILAKRRFELLSHAKFIDHTEENPIDITLYLSKNLSDHIAGDYLFGRVMALFDDPHMGYSGGMISITIKNNNDSIVNAVTFLTELSDKQNNYLKKHG